MIKKISVFSEQPGAPVLPLVGFQPNNDPVQLLDVAGLGPVKADITSTPFATGRGALYQGSTVGMRNIVLKLGLNPAWEEQQTMATLRRQLYRYLLPQQWTKLRFFTDELPMVDIEGWVESFEPNMFSQDPEIQVSILCPNPDFIEPEATILNGVVDDGTIEAEFEYIGDIATGFELKVERSVDNPSYTGPLEVIVRSPTEPKTFSVDEVTINTTQYFNLNSVRNSKRVQHVAYADGAIINLLGQLSAGSEWPALEPGTNAVSVSSAEDGQVWTLAYFSRFGGL